MVVLSGLSLSFAYQVSLSSRSSRSSLVMARLRSHASSAVAIAIARLRENGNDKNDFDHRAESWSAHATLAGEDWLADWSQQGDGSEAEYVTDYQVVDEQSKLNILFASSDSLERLGMSEEQIASVLDWMDGDDVAGSEGAESRYYKQASELPYVCKDGPIEHLSELLMIRGFSALDFAGEDANHNRILDESEDDGPATYPDDNADGELQLGWVDLLTTVGDGRININTAPRAVLASLAISDGAVDQLIQYRSGDADSGADIAEFAFAGPDEIDQLQGLSAAEREAIKMRATYKSTHFRIFAQARHLPTGLAYRLDVLVEANGDEVQIIQWRAGV